MATTEDPVPTPDTEPQPEGEPQPVTTPDQPDTTPDTEPDTDETSDEKARLRAENQRLKREAAQREKEKRQAEKAAKDAADKRAEEQGEWKRLAEERQRENQELRAQLAERDAKDIERDQRTLVQSTAERLNFRRPRRAYALLIDELGPEHAGDTLADEQLTEAALKRLAKAEPELVDNQRRSGAPVNGTTAGQTPDQEMASFLKGLVGIPTD